MYAPSLPPVVSATSPHIPVGLEKKLIDKVDEQRRLASIENNNASTIMLMHASRSPSEPSNLFYTRLSTGPVPAPIFRAELPPIPHSLQLQQLTIPAAAVQPAQQQAQPPASETSARLKRQAASEPAGHFDFLGTTPESYQADQKARAEKKAKAQQDLPELPPAVSTKRTYKPREKAGLDFKDPLTPKTYPEVHAKTRRNFTDPYYSTSEEALDAAEWISEAVQYLDAKEYAEAVTALHLAFEKLPHAGFVYKLFDNTQFDAALSLHPDHRICTSDPEEDLDVLVLRGIRKIKHGKFDQAKIDLQKILTQKPNDEFARLIFDHACELSNRLNRAVDNSNPEKKVQHSPPSGLG
jgi:hypothetical protein